MAAKRPPPSSEVLAGSYQQHQRRRDPGNRNFTGVIEALGPALGHKSLRVFKDVLDSNEKRFDDRFQPLVFSDRKRFGGRF